MSEVKEEPNKPQQQQCAQCKKVGTELLRCSRCKGVWYCSPECQKHHWSKHKLRCSIFKYPEPEESIEINHLSRSVSGTGLFAKHSFEAGDVIFAELATMSAPIRKLKYVQNDSQDVSKLIISIHSKLTGAFWDSAAEIAEKETTTVSLWSLVYMIASYFDCNSEATRSFVDSLCEPPKIPQDKETGFKQLAKELLKVPLILVTKIPENQLYHLLLKIDNNQHLCKEAKKVAIFKHGSVMTHSCSPNTVFHSTKDCAIIYRAIKHIEKGELLTSSYIDDLSVLLPTKRRRELLLSTKGFICRCSRCLKPDQSRSIKCPKCGKEQVMPIGILSQPQRDDEKPYEHWEAVKEIAENKLWVCQNVDCKQEFYNVEQPFSAEENLMTKVIDLEKQMNSSSNAELLLKSAEELLKACQEILGSSHWCVGQLIYIIMIQLQVIATKLHSRDLHMKSAVVAKDFWEWTMKSAGDCVIVCANAAFFAGRLCETLEMDEMAIQLYNQCLQVFEYSFGKDSADVKRIKTFILKKLPQ